MDRFTALDMPLTPGHPDIILNSGDEFNVGADASLMFLITAVGFVILSNTSP